ncbi:unnamed protein product [Albugo candida]|uniref:Exocyst complex component n=1 Tax=Albugo candida TaxID=65357 RepID=A0A024G9I2_9STRA|nr:unnamed protein product [Albugo candida]|eukprot:CCI43215.1 unnamed protein product [Albugo candida]
MSKDEPKWGALVENTAQCHTKLATGIQVAVERHCENKFSTNLRAFALAKETEIRDVCDTNHQDFVNAIEELIRMKSDMIRVQENVLSFQMQLKDATQPVLAADDSLQSHLQTQRHIDESLDKLAQCQRIVGLASRVDSYINGGKLFHAYKLVQDLRIEVASFREIGDAATDRSENQVYEQQFEEEILENRGKNEGSSIITKQENFLLSSRSKPLEKTNLLGSFISESAQRYENSSTRGIPIAEKDVPLTRDGVHEAYMKRTLEIISPILRTLHVFREMGELSELATYYNANRLPQLQLPAFLTGDVAMITPEKFMGQHQILLKKFTGAFCVEHFIWRYTQGDLLSKKDINGTFQHIIQSMCGIVTASILRTRSPESILELKQNAITCARTLGDELHQYNTTSIFDAFRKLGPHFRHSLLTDTKANLRQFLSEDTFTHVHISKTEIKDVHTFCMLSTYEAFTFQTFDLCGIFGNEALLKKFDLSQNSITLPFTEIVRKSCRSVETLIQMMFDYERFLNINDWGDAVRDDTIEALGYLNEILNNWIDDSSDLQVSMVVVMGVNASYLAVACNRFDHVVRHQTGAWESRTYKFGVTNHTHVKHNADSEVITKPLSKAGAKKQFENTMTRAQDMVCELMIKKIDELVNSFYYMNWTPAEASVQPDPAMWDLISYLQVTFAQLSELPTSVREAVHFASCIHISKSLEQILYGPNIKKITPAAIMNLKRNLDALLEFIDGLKIHHLRESFSALSQIIDLLISGNLEIFLDPQSRGTSKNFPQLSPDNVASISEKMKDSKSRFWGKSGHHGAKKGKGIIGSVVKSFRK